MSLDKVEILGSPVFTAVPSLGVSGYLREEVQFGHTRVNGVSGHNMIWGRETFDVNANGAFDTTIILQPYGLATVSGA